MIGVIDYGMGNLYSVHNAFRAMGARVKIVSRPEELKKCEKLVFPGVGSFGDAMAELKKRSLIEAIKDNIRSKPFLGICLGMQLLLSRSEESGDAQGLGVIQGHVKKFPSRGEKVPHMGWNQIILERKDPLLKNVKNKSYVYFCHSYYAKPRSGDDILCLSRYGVAFASVISQGHVYGLQFHPEKSQRTGCQMIKNFIEEI